jgi:hypothetical protein
MVGFTERATVSVIATLCYPVIKPTQCAAQWVLGLVTETGLTVEFL